MSEGNRRQDAAHAATLPGVGDGATAVSIDPRAVGHSATLPASDTRGIPHAPTLPGPHTVADHPSLRPIPEHSYSIGEEIARGGMGKILSARDRRLRRDVVIKVTRHEDGHVDPRFEREALITARLQHPSIVRVYEAGMLEDGRAFYAMERVRGQSLEVVLEATHSLRERLSLLPHAIAVTDAIAYAHNEGVLHRDLKPSNVLIGPFGETVVIDWGLAKDLRAADIPGGSSPQTPSSSDSSLTQVGSVMGTPSYMAPEQARGDVSDERTDVYALGALLYTLLSGVPPHRGRTTEEVLESVAAGRRVPIAEREPTCPPELATIVERAMSKVAADRYANAKDLADELRRFAAGKLVASHTYSLWRLLKRWVRRHAITVGVAAFAVVVFAILGAFMLREVFEERDRANAEESAAQLARIRAERSKDDLVIDQATDAMKKDPSRAVAWVAQLSNDALDWPKTQALVSDAAARGLARELRGHTADIEILIKSPDGRRVATASDDGTIRIWTIGDETSIVLAGHNGPIEGIAFSPDGTTLASAGTDSTVWLWNGTTGHKLDGGHSDTVRAVVFSPDGTQLASTSEDGTLWRWDVRTGAGKELIHHTHGLRPIVWTRDAIIVGGFDGTIGRFDPITGRGTLQRAHKAEIRSLAVSPDGKYIAAGDETGVVNLWTVGGELVARLGSHTDVVRDLQFTADGTHVASAGGDKFVHVHSIPPTQPLELRGNTDGVKDLDISPDGAWVATAGIDGTVRVWPIGGGEPRTFRGHGTAVKGVVFAPGDRLISVGEDDHGRIWRLDVQPPPPTGTALRAWIDKQTNVVVRPPRAPN